MAAVPPLENPETILLEANYILKLAVGLDNIGKSLKEDCPICMENFTNTSFFTPSDALNPISQRNKLISCGCPKTGNQHIFHESCLNMLGVHGLCPICRCILTKKKCKISERTNSEVCDNGSYESTVDIHAIGKGILANPYTPETHELLRQIEVITHQAEAQIRQREEEEEARVSAILRERLGPAAEEPMPERQGLFGWMSNYLPNMITRRRPSGREQASSSRSQPYGGKSNKKTKRKKTKKQKNKRVNI